MAISTKDNPLYFVTENSVEKLPNVIIVIPRPIANSILKPRKDQKSHENADKIAPTNTTSKPLTKNGFLPILSGKEAKINIVSPIVRKRVDPIRDYSNPVSSHSF